MCSDDIYFDMTGQEPVIQKVKKIIFEFHLAGLELVNEKLHINPLICFKTPYTLM